METDESPGFDSMGVDHDSRVASSHETVDVNDALIIEGGRLSFIVPSVDCKIGEVEVANPYIDLYVDSPIEKGDRLSSGVRRKNNNEPVTAKNRPNSAPMASNKNNNVSHKGLSKNTRSNLVRANIESKSTTIEPRIRAREEMKKSMHNSMMKNVKAEIDRSKQTNLSSSQQTAADLTGKGTKSKTVSSKSTPSQKAKLLPSSSLLLNNNNNRNNNHSNNNHNNNHNSNNNIKFGGGNETKAAPADETFGGLSDKSVAIMKDWVSSAQENLKDDQDIENSDDIFDLIPNLLNSNSSLESKLEYIDFPPSYEEPRTRPTKRIFGSIIRAERMKPLLFIWDKEPQDCNKLLIKRQLGIAEKLRITATHPKRCGSLRTEYNENYKGEQPKPDGYVAEPDVNTTAHVLRAAAEKAYNEATNALNSLQKADIIEVKGFFKPPKGVDDVFAATMILLAGIHPDIILNKDGSVKDISWDACKKQLLKSIPDYMESLKSIKTKIDEKLMPTDNIAKVRPLLELEHFKPEIISKKSKAAMVICSFVKNIVDYYELMSKVYALISVGTEAPAASELVAKAGKSKKGSKSTKAIDKKVVNNNDCECWVSEHKLNYKRYSSASYHISPDTYTSSESDNKANTSKVMIMKKLERTDIKERPKSK